jgi:hypothetical protein
VSSIAEIFKRVPAFVGINPKDVHGVSGHSVRVGATQGPLALNIDLASVMQAGRWKSNRMPMRYGEHVLASYPASGLGISLPTSQHLTLERGGV